MKIFLLINSIHSKILVDDFLPLSLILHVLYWHEYNSQTEFPHHD